MAVYDEEEDQFRWLGFKLVHELTHKELRVLSKKVEQRQVIRVGDINDGEVIEITEDENAADNQAPFQLMRDMLNIVNGIKYLLVTTGLAPQGNQWQEGAAV